MGHFNKLSEIKMKKINARKLHRDLGYFYLGLIITFAFSGILLNHRENWHPEKITIENKSIELQLPKNESEINEEFAQKTAEAHGLEGKVRRHMIRKGTLRIQLENSEIEVNAKTGKGEIVHFIKTPVISQAIKLHKNTSAWWIYFSDIFGISLIIIAITGAMMVKHGKHTFKRKGWKLAVAGIVFPILFLLFF